jgi:uncharacterized sulfatase
LIISVPGLKTAGQASPRLAELVDLYPTLAEVTGLTPPPGLQGFSLRPLLLNPTAPWDHPAFTQVQRREGPGHTVRTDRWRYTQWVRGANGEELYDQQEDPQELRNLAALPEHASTVAELKALLQQGHPVPVRGGKAEPGTRAKFCN